MMGGKESDEGWIVRRLKQIRPYPEPGEGIHWFFVKEAMVSRYNYAKTLAAARVFRPDVGYVSDLKRVLGPAFALRKLGVPVVGTMVGGQPELFRDGLHCLTYEATDAEHLASRIRCLDDDRLRHAIVDAAYREVHSDYSFCDYADRIGRFLERAADA